MTLTRCASTAWSASSAGQIVTVEPTIVLGALDQSIIKTLDVREGQRVQKGQLLATLDPTFTTADVGALKSQVANLTAQIARAQAELAQKPFVLPPPTDKVAASFFAMQNEYYTQRKAQYDAQVRSYNEQIGQYKATIGKYQADMAKYGDRARISKQIEEMRATLAAAQVGSRLNLLSATDQKLEIERALEFDRNAVIESQHQLDSTTATRDAYIQQWLGQTSQELVKAQGDRDNAVEQLNKATKHQDQGGGSRGAGRQRGAEARQTVAGLGAEPGRAADLLAPLKSPFEIEARVAARDVGFIRAGDEVTVKLDAFNFIEHGTVAGKVRSISEGAFTVDDNNQPVDPYYRVRITLDPIALRNVPASFRLVPGMTLSADIHIGTRSLFMYLLSGVVRGVDEAMREP